MDHQCGSARTKVVVTKPFWKDGTMMSNTVSLCQISGGQRNRSFKMMQLHWKIIPTWLHGQKSERQILEKFFECRRYSRTIESARMTNIQKSMEKETNQSLLHNKSGNGLINNLKAFQEYDYRLEPRTGWRFHPSSRTTHSSSSSHCQQNSDWKSNGSWDSWETSSWTEQ